ADQRRDEVQQDAFLIAQELAKEWTSHVFISLRPGTFYRSRATGVLAAYPHRVFTISPPRMDDFLEKRLTYALDMAEGRLPVERLSGIRLNIASVGFVIRALLHSLKHNDDLHEFLANITGGNVRELLQFVTSFIGSPNVDADKIVSIMKQRKGRYRIPLHEFSKAALLGDYSHYQSESSIAMNVFDTRRSDPREHFLVLLIMAFLDHQGQHRDRSGFAPLDVIVSEMQRHGFAIDQVEDAVRRTTNKRLIETPHRAVFDDELQMHFASLHEKYRLTARGAYHLRRWVPSFAYLDAMAFDTPIYDEGFRERAMVELESFDIRTRYARALDFRTYLQARWLDANIEAPYFDFTDLVRRGESTFVAVRQAAQH
ncbi:MAG: hypothetical protein MN733_07395, partial [Nitrososphaera sp.]|nr:hypothetical protein [Nitrososphaera sp.]